MASNASPPVPDRAVKVSVSIRPSNDARHRRWSAAAALLRLATRLPTSLLCLPASAALRFSRRAPVLVGTQRRKSRRGARGGKAVRWAVLRFSSGGPHSQSLGAAASTACGLWRRKPTISNRLLPALHYLRTTGSPASLSIPMHVGGARLGGNLRDRDPALVDSGCSPPVAPGAAGNADARRDATEPASGWLSISGPLLRRAGERSRRLRPAGRGGASTFRAIGYVGRLSPEKNCIAVGNAVAAMGAPYRAVFVGPSYDPAYARQVHAAARGGIFVPPVEHVGDALAALDVLVLVSPAEGGPLVLLEALAAGLPVVATPVGNLPDLVQRHGELFVTVPVDPTQEQLAAAARRALAPEWRLPSSGIRAVIEQHFSA